MNDVVYDIVFVGGGLSAAATLYGLYENVKKSCLDNKLKILVFNKDENFWTGVPYGNRAEPDYFLIHTLENTQCSPFSDWIYKNIKAICGNNDFTYPALQKWYRKNQHRFASEDLQNIYFPRRWFGMFIRQYMQTTLVKNKNNSVITLINEEVVDINRIDTGYQVIISGERQFLTKNVILAVGSIPKNDYLSSDEEIGNFPEYICDDVACAHFDLESRLAAPLGERNRASDVVIIGSSASALETIYFIATRENVRRKISKITVLSTSGLLVGGLKSHDSDESDVSPHVSGRSSSDTYIDAMLELAEDGLLCVIKGKAENVARENGRFLLTYGKNNGAGSEGCLAADFVINCSGRGSILNTTSTLLKQLSGKFPVEEKNRGFEMDSHNQIVGFPGFYVIGPLLNRGIAKQVESIAAVFNEGKAIANELTQKLIERSGVAATE